MKKQTLIIIILCVLVAVVISMSVFGVVGPRGSFTGYSRNGDPPSASPLNTLPDIDTPWDPSYETET